MNALPHRTPDEVSTEGTVMNAMTEPVRRAVIVVGAIVLIGGIAGLIVSSGQDLTEPRGARVGALMHLNPLGSWVSIALGVLTIVGGVLRSHAAVLAASVGLFVCVVFVTFGANRPTNPLGGTASTVSFYLGPAAGLLALVLAERAAQQAASSSVEATDDAAREHDH